MQEKFCFRCLKWGHQSYQCKMPIVPPTDPLPSACAAIAFLIFVSWSQPAAAHSWYSAYCCNMQDCGPITKAEQRNGKWYYTNKTGKAVAVDADTRFEQSKDGETHSCEWYGKLRCLYIPGGN